MWYVFLGLAGLILYSAFRTKEPDDLDDYVCEIRPLNPQPVYRHKRTQTDPESPMKLVRNEPIYYFENVTKQNKQK